MQHWAQDTEQTKSNNTDNILVTNPFLIYYTSTFKKWIDGRKFRFPQEQEDRRKMVKTFVLHCLV